VTRPDSFRAEVCVGLAVAHRWRSAMLIVAMLWLGTSIAAAEPHVDVQLDTMLKQAATADASEMTRLHQQFENTLATSQGKTDALRVAMYRADWLRIKGQRALAESAATTSKPAERDARQCLLLAIDRYAEIIDAAEARLDRMERNDPHADTTDRWKTTSAIVPQAQYSMAWAYLSAADIALDKNERRRHFDRAEERFAALTQEIDWSKPLIVDCLIGRAMANVGQTKYRQALALLSAVTPTLMDRATFLRITSVRMAAHEKLDDFSAAAEDAETYFRGSDPAHADTPGERLLRLNWAVALAEDIASHPLRTADDRRRQALLDVATTVSGYGPAWQDRLKNAMPKRLPSLVELDAWQQCNEAMARKQWADAYATAERGLSNAPAMPKLFRDDLAYAAAMATFAMKRWDVAFAHGQAFLETCRDDRRAATIRENTLIAAVNGSTQMGMPSPKAALAFIDRIAEESPTMQMARGRWYRGWVMLADRQTDSAIAILKTIPADSDAYAAAQFGLACVWRQKLAECTTKDDVRRTLQYIAEAVECYARSDPLPNKTMTHAVIDAAVIAMDQMLCGTAVDETTLHGFVQRVATLSSRTSYRCDEMAQWRCWADVYRGDVPSAMAELDRVAMDTPAVFEIVAEQGQRYYLAAADTTPQKARFGECVAQCLQRAAALSRSPEASQPLRVRLAEHLSHQGQYDDAANVYQAMLSDKSQRPSQQAMRGLASVREKQKRWDDAIDLWRTLASSLTAASDPWFEANMRLVSALRHAGRINSASATLKLVQLRCDGHFPDRWKKPFSDLAATMTPSSTRSQP